MSKRHRLPNSGKKEEGAVESTDASVEQSEPEVATESATAEPADLNDDAAAQAAVVPEADDPAVDAPEGEPAVEKRRIDWSRVLAFGVIPAVALLLAIGAGYLKWQDNSVRNANEAAAESVQVAKDSTAAMLSYQPETVEQQLNDARSQLTGEFLELYTGLINDVVIPGAKERQISAVTSVPAAASVSADSNEAVVLMFVNQTVLVGQDVPTDTASSVRVTLEKVDGRWLISKFDPV